MLHVTASQVRISVKFIDTAPTLDIEFEDVEIVSPEPANTLENLDGTVKIHLKSLYKSLGVRNRSQAAIAGLEILAKQ